MSDRFQASRRRFIQLATAADIAASYLLGVDRIAASSADDNGTDADVILY